MLFQTLTLAIVGMFYALAALEDFPRIGDPEETNIACSCKKKKKNSLKEADLFACEGHDEPLEEEKFV